MDAEGTKGFSVSIDQLKTERALWIPSLGVYVTASTAGAAGAAGEQPVAFADHLKTLAARKGQRILDRVKHEPEATDAQFLARWEDMGSPLWSYPEQRGPGHIVGITWDSAIRKFGIDRAGGVWNDEGNPRQVPVLAVGRRSRARRRADVERAAADGRIADPHDHVRGRRPALRAGAVRVSARRTTGRAARRHRDGADATSDGARAARRRAARAGLDGAPPPDAGVSRRLHRDVQQESATLFRGAGAARRAARPSRAAMASRSGTARATISPGRTDRSASTRRCFSHVPANGTRQFVVNCRRRRWMRRKAQTLAAIDYAASARGDAEVLVGLRGARRAVQGAGTARQRYRSARIFGSRCGYRGVMVARTVAARPAARAAPR